MSEFHTIEIDLDVFKHIQAARQSFDEKENCILRRLFRISAPSLANSSESAAQKRAWSGKGVRLPHGTRIRMEYNGRTHDGEIYDGMWLVEGREYTSPSDAASGAARTRKGTATRLNGWNYWLALMPGEADWRKLSDLRQSLSDGAT